MLNTQHLRYAVQNSVALEHTSRPTAATVSLYSGTGAAIFEGESATVSTINTTLDAAAEPGDTTLSVAANTGITVGSILHLANPVERVLVAATPAQTVVELRRPVLRDHESGSTVTGGRLTYTVSAANSSTLLWDGRLEWTIDTNTIRHQHCICTKYPFARVATIQDVFDEQANFEDIIPANLDVERALDRALDEVVKRVAIATSNRPYVYTGPHQFVDATVMAFLMQFYRPRASDSAQRLFERYEKALADEVEGAMLTTPRDGDQDGSVEADELRSSRSARIFRG